MSDAKGTDTPQAIERSVAQNPLVRGDVDPQPVHAIITNSTYDGLCYDVARVETLLGETVDRLHFDEAWYGYARFNPIYAGRHAMHGDPAAGRRSSSPVRGMPSGPIGSTNLGSSRP